MQGRRRSFSLIELLIAMAIVAILFGLVMHAFKSARESAYCLQVRTQLTGVPFKSGPRILKWTADRCIQVEWTEGATSEHPVRKGVGEFDLDQGQFLHLEYFQVPIVQP